MMPHANYPLTAVINVRNGEVYIRETLESLLSQTQAVNVLVIDNHSTDRTAKIVSEFPEVTRLMTPEPMTLGAARNFGLSQVSSPFIAWIDSDDLWDPAFAETVLTAMEERAGIVMGTTGTVSIDPQGRIIGLKDSYHRKYCIPFWRRSFTRREIGDTFTGIVVRMRPKWAWCAHVFRTEAVREVGGFDSSLVYSVDLDLIAKLLRLGEAVHVPVNLTRYRRHPDQDTRKQKPETLYGEKLLVTSRIGRETGVITAVFFKRMQKVTELKCQAAHFLRERSWRSAWALFRALWRPEVFAYYWRVLLTA